MKSTGSTGLMVPGSPPSSTMASRIAAMSPSNVMPDDSGIMTRAGRKLTSQSLSGSRSQRRKVSISLSSALPTA